MPAWQSATTLCAPAHTVVLHMPSERRLHVCPCLSRRRRCWGHLSFGLSKIPPGVRFTSIAAGYYHVCGYARDGALHCWGMNYDGQTEVSAGATRLLPAGRMCTVEHRPALMQQCPLLPTRCTPVRLRVRCQRDSTLKQSAPRPLRLPSTSRVEAAALSGSWRTVALGTSSALLCWRSV